VLTRPTLLRLCVQLLCMRHLRVFRTDPPVPVPLRAQTVVVYAATKGYLDKVPVNKITGTEDIILKHIDPKVFKVRQSRHHWGKGTRSRRQRGRGPAAGPQHAHLATTVPLTNRQPLTTADPEGQGQDHARAQRAHGAADVQPAAA
jgi:hypothetical protein